MVYCISKLCQVQPISPYNLGYCMYFNSKPVSKVYFYFVLRANIRISHPIKTEASLRLHKRIFKCPVGNLKPYKNSPVTFSTKLKVLLRTRVNNNLF